ncbi:MAG: PilZ domain-containing protein [Candidatus Hydrogenedentes bacterium]|nr:PilZ domain-containing protein [Candidatus Hydrogenedentota bacterium]
MSTTTAAKDERRFVRVPFTGLATYRCGSRDTGGAVCLDVGRGGMRVELGRYLRPGRRLLVSVSGLPGQNERIELKARVAWCRPTTNPSVFLTGLRVFHDDARSVAGLTELFYRGLEQMGLIACASGDGTPGSEGPERPNEAGERPVGARWTLLRVGQAARPSMTAAMAVVAAGLGQITTW